MIRLPSIAVILTLIALVAAPAGAQMGSAAPVTVTMNAQNGSGESGTATLTQTADGVQVVISISNGSAAAQPAHVHPGTCVNLNPAPQYPLTSVQSGKSTTVIKGVTLQQLTSGTFAINVHKSTSDLGTYVSCGDIKA